MAKKDKIQRPMQLQGIRIEYLITGGISIIWLYPLIEMLRFGDETYSADLRKSGLIFIPIAYVLGMTIDFIAREIFSKSKNKIRKEIYARNKMSKSNQEILIEVLHHDAELHKRLETRETRYRIARGLFVNLLLSLLVTFVWFWMIRKELYEDQAPEIRNPIYWKQGVIQLMTLLLLIFSWKMWKEYLRRYCKQQIYLMKHINATSKNGQGDLDQPELNQA